MSISKLAFIFDKVIKTGVPQKANNSWLTQIGMKSTNDRRLLVVLKFIGFVDGDGTPTDRWKEYRGTGHRAVLGQAVRDAYRELYDTYPNAHAESTTDLVHIVRATTGLAEDTSTRAVQTFKALVQLADMPSGDQSTPRQTVAVSTSAPDRVTRSTQADSHAPAQTVVLNVNVQLSLPESSDPAVYEALFASLARHVLNTSAPEKK